MTDNITSPADIPEGHVLSTVSFVRLHEDGQPTCVVCFIHEVGQPPETGRLLGTFDLEVENLPESARKELLAAMQKLAVALITHLNEQLPPAERGVVRACNPTPELNAQYIAAREAANIPPGEKH
jgi:hypothetical protein